MGLRQLIAPAVYPLTLSEARGHLRAEDHSADDAEILRYLRSATAEVERLSARQIVDSKWRYTLREWPETKYPARLVVPRAPLVDVTAITYLDGSGTRQTLSAANYVVSPDEEPGALEPAYGLYWPAAREIADSIRVDYWSGMAAPATALSDGTFTVFGRPLETGDEIAFWSPGEMPANLEAGKTYYVVGASASGAESTFQVATTSGGSGLATLGALGDSLWVTNNWQLFATARQAVSLLLGHRYEAREESAGEQSYQIPRGADHLIEQLQYGAEFYRWSL